MWVSQQIHSHRCRLSCSASTSPSPAGLPPAAPHPGQPPGQPPEQPPPPPEGQAGISKSRVCSQSRSHFKLHVWGSLWGSHLLGVDCDQGCATSTDA